MKTLIYNFKKVILLFFVLLGMQYGFSQSVDADISMLSVSPASGPYHEGQTITYNFRITNNSVGLIGFPLTIDSLVLTSIIPEGFEFRQSDNTETWLNPVGNNLILRDFVNIHEKGGVEEYSLVLRFKGNSGGVDNWKTRIELYEFFKQRNKLSDLDPDNHTQGDTDWIEHRVDVFDLALKSNTGTVYPNYGDEVEFDVVVYNQGSKAAHDVVVANYKFEGFELVPSPDWTYDASTGNWKHTFPGPIAPGGSAETKIKLKLLPVKDQREWANYVEIVSAKDGSGAFMVDFDGIFDEDPNNDAGGKPNSGSDDFIEGNGSGPVGGINPDTDEDNHDPGFLRILDLALEKTTSDPLITNFGDVVKFDFDIHNQGTVPVRDVKITDYLPSGYTYDPNDNIGSGWTMVGGNLERTVPLIVQPGNSTSVSLNLRLNDVVSDHTEYVNYSEITGASDINNNVFQEYDDADSEMASNSAQEREVLPGTLYDNDVWRQISSGYQDDFDPAIANFFDLALKKKVKPELPTSPYLGGNQVEFVITVYNQGGVVANNIKVVDYIPDGYEFISVNTPTWTHDDVNNRAFTTITTPLATGDSVEISLFLKILPVDDKVSSYLNAAEIESATDEVGTPMPKDIDSNMDNDEDNDAGGAYRTASDDSLIGDGKGGVGDTDANTDEDDHDIALPQIYDIALKHTLETPAPHQYGQEHTFKITLYNQGNMPLTNIEVEDYIASGYDFVPSTGWTHSGNTAKYTYKGTLNPGQSTDIEITLKTKMTNGGEKDWINYATVTGMTDNAGNDRAGWDIDSHVGSDTPEERSVELNDSNDNNILVKGTYENEDQDDHDPAGIELFDLALRKIVNTVYYPFNYNSIIPFKITVYNQGSIEARNVKVTDYIPEGFDFVLSNNPGWTENSLNSSVEYTIPDPIAPGGSTDIFINLVVLPNISSGDSWVNIAEISYAEDKDGNDMSNSDFDSWYDKDKDNDVGATPDVAGEDDFIDGDAKNGATNEYSEEEDDHDSGRIHVFDLALNKKMITSNPNYGDIVDFEITVYNQGNDDAQNVEIKDYTPEGFEFSAGINPGWSGSINTGLSYTHTGVIPAKGQVTIPLKLRLVNSQGGKSNWINYAEIEDAENATAPGFIYIDPDSNPGSDFVGERDVKPGDAADDNIVSNDKGREEDDHDPAGIYIFDLALRNTIKGVYYPFNYNDVIPFEITVYNQGNVEAKNVKVTDYIPEGFDLVLANNPGWTEDGLNSSVEYTITAPIAPGDSAKVLLNLTVIPNVNSGDSWVNIAEISYAEDKDGSDMSGLDFDSWYDEDKDNDAGGRPDVVNEDNFIDGDAKHGDTNMYEKEEDDHDPERIHVLDLALKKTMITASPIYGDIVDFEITVYNQGNDDAQNVEISDYAPEGFEFSAGANPGWSGSISTGLTYIHTGVIPAKGQVTIPLQLRLASGEGGEDNWINYAEIKGAQNATNPAYPYSDPDSNPGSNSNEEKNVKPGDVADNDILSNDKGGEEDDHDPAGVEIFDLALRNITKGVHYPFNYGDIVPFEITVYNQGSQEAKNVKVTDYIPSGFDFVLANNYGWIEDALNNKAEYTITGPIEPGDSVHVLINLTVIANTDPGDSWINIAEISYAEDKDGNDMSDLDFDSWYDEDKGNDAGGRPDVVNEDNFIDGDAKHGATNIYEEEEDDHDPEKIHVFDLALKKKMISVDPSYGDIIDFEITIYNQGNEDAINVDIKDYCPEGFEFSAGLNTGWSGSISTGLSYTYTGLISAKSEVTIPLKLRLVGTQGGKNHWINYAEIQGAENATNPAYPYIDSDSNPGSDSGEEKKVKPGDASDDDVMSNDKGGEEDDHDPAGIWIRDLALKKEIIEDGPYKYGDTIKFKVTVYNQGNTPARDIEVVDYNPQGLQFCSASFPTWHSDPFTGNSHATISNIITPGDSIVLDLFYKLRPITSECMEGAYTNNAEIFQFEDENSNILFEDFDSKMDYDPDNDVGGTPQTSEDNHIDDDRYDYNNDGIYDEDDSDPAVVDIVDVALKAEFVSGEIKYLKTHKYRLRVFNQSNIPVKNTKVKAYLPDGYEIDFSANPGWSSIDTTAIIPDTISPCDSFDLFVDLRMVRTNGGYKDWTNYFEITEVYNQLGEDRTDWDLDSELGSNTAEERSVELGDANDNNIFVKGTAYNEDQDDHDPAGIHVFDLALKKIVTPPSSTIKYGEEVEFKITLYNQGSIESQNIQIKEEAIPCGLEFSSSNSGWVYSGNSATYTYNSILIPGSNVEIPVRFNVLDCNNTNWEDSWKNNAEIVYAEDNLGNDKSKDDVDSNYDDDPLNDLVVDDALQLPESQDDDDHDIAIVKVYDLALKIIADDRGPMSPGDIAVFTITLHNQGNQSLEDIVVYDYISEGYSLVAGSTNPGWTLHNATTAEYTYGGPLTPGDSCKIKIKLKVENGDEIPAFVHYAEVASAKTSKGVNLTDDADGQFASDTNYEREVFVGHEWDNEIFGIGFRADPSEDMDDHDPASVDVVGKVGDFVWHDLNGNGLQDPGEPGVPNVIVELHNVDYGLETQYDTTDINGHYLFDLVMPGTYYLKFRLYGDYEFTIANQGNYYQSHLNSDVDGTNGFGTTANFKVKGNDRILDKDAGVYKCVPLGDLVWLDYIKNNVYDHGVENGVNGLKVELYKLVGTEWTLWDIEFTGINPKSDCGDGYYYFCTMPGKYYLRFVQPPTGIVPVAANVGYNDNIDSDVTRAHGLGTTNTFTLISGTAGNLTIDAGFLPMSTIKNSMVWIDNDLDGVKDPGEPGVPNMGVELYDAEGILYSSTTTDSKGSYELDYLQAENYYLKFKIPAPQSSAYGFTESNKGSDDKDSDVTGENGAGTTALFNLGPQQSKEHKDAGLAFGALPQNYLSVGAELKDGYVRVDWATANQYNVGKYIVQRSYGNLVDFVNVGEVKAKEEDSNSYTFDDHSEFKNGVYYYRIVSVDLDGFSSKSDFVAVFVSNGNESMVEVYPNPIVDEATIRFSLQSPSSVIMDVLDIEGRIVKSGLVNEKFDMGIYHVNLDLNSLKPATYHLRVKSDSETIFKKIIVVSK